MCIESISYVRTSVGAAGGIQPWVASKVPEKRGLRSRAAALLTAGLLSPGFRF